MTRFCFCWGVTPTAGSNGVEPDFLRNARATKAAAVKPINSLFMLLNIDELRIRDCRIWITAINPLLQPSWGQNPQPWLASFAFVDNLNQ